MLRIIEYIYKWSYKDRILVHWPAFKAGGFVYSNERSE